MEITSKRHPFKFYLNLILINVFFLILISIFTIFFSDNTKFLIGSLILLVILISINVGFIKNAPIITLDKEGITFKNNFINWNELSSAKLTGKGDMIFTSGECVTLTFKDNTKIQIFDDFYSNISEMKCFIQEIIIEKKDDFEVTRQETNSIDIDQELFVPYKGNPVFSFEGFFMWVIILFIAFIPLFSSKPFSTKGIIFTLFLAIFMFPVFSRMMYYFEISKGFFVIKNHYFFWKKEDYPISDIREVVYEQQHRQPNRIRLITKDFKSKLYIAASLNRKTWLEMKKNLESKNIIVRNECIPEN
jgi:hypothetical protein